MNAIAPLPPSNQLVTEDSAAQRFVDLYAGRLRYCHDRGAWFEWTGSVWQENKTGLAFHWARLLARDLSDSEPDKVRYITSKTNFAGGVERFARTDPAFATTTEFWDRDPMLLGTPSGTIDLTNGVMRPGDPEDGITRSTAVAPAETADCPEWNRFLCEATGGDDGLIRFLQQWSGYCLTGKTTEHALVFCHGDGRNGKSTFQNAIAGLLGDYAAAAPMDTFTASSWDRHPTELAMLRGARLVTASETEEGRGWAEARIKAITGGDPITARFMRRDFFTFVPTFKLTIVGNHRPSLQNVDEAMRRRFNIVPFTRKPAKPDPDLQDKLRAEWPGILRWMINGCLDWQAAGLCRPAIVIDETTTYFAEQDLFGQWLDDACDVEPGNAWKWETSSDLFASWSQYATQAGEKAGTQKHFGSVLQKRGIEKHRTTTARGYSGIRLNRKPAVHDG